MDIELTTSSKYFSLISLFLSSPFDEGSLSIFSIKESISIPETGRSFTTILRPLWFLGLWLPVIMIPLFVLFVFASK